MLSLTNTKSLHKTDLSEATCLWSDGNQGFDMISYHAWLSVWYGWEKIEEIQSLAEDSKKKKRNC